MQTVAPENTKPLKDSEKPEKKGGPYSKKEQEERKIKVYHLHFEENKSAVEIAELLNVSRNTINDDIKYWHQQLANEFKAQDLTAKMTKQIHRTEMQRDRLLEYLDDAEKFDEKIKLEKFISDIDNGLVQLFSKMISSGKTILEPTVKLDEINEDEIKELVRHEILEEQSNIVKEDDILHDVIKMKKCEIGYAKNVFKKMQELGLDVCKAGHDNYNLHEFAMIRDYVSDDEFKKLEKEMHEQEKKEEKLEAKWEAKFIKKYGADKSKWSDEVRDEYIDED